MWMCQAANLARDGRGGLGAALLNCGPLGVVSRRAEMVARVANVDGHMMSICCPLAMMTGYKMSICCHRKKIRGERGKLQIESRIFALIPTNGVCHRDEDEKESDREILPNGNIYSISSSFAHIRAPRLLL